LNQALVYIAERMSLGVGICVCAMLGSAQPRTSVRYTLFAVTLLFFGFLYGDERKLNSYEDRRQDTVAMAMPLKLNTTNAAATSRFGVTKPPVNRGSASGRPAHDVDPGSSDVM
jgi:hypothetical protein